MGRPSFEVADTLRHVAHQCFAECLELVELRGVEGFVKDTVSPSESLSVNNPLVACPPLIFQSPAGLSMFRSGAERPSRGRSVLQPSEHHEILESARARPPRGGRAAARSIAPIGDLGGRNATSTCSVASFTVVLSRMVVTRPLL
jgi:hypothetical protein